MSTFSTFVALRRSAGQTLALLLWCPFRESPFALIALLTQVVMHIIWAWSASVMETNPVVIGLFLDYNADFVLLPLVIAVGIVLRRITVNGIVKDTWSVLIGAVVGELLGCAAAQPFGSTLDFTMHCAFAAIHSGVCVPIVVTMICLKKWTQRDSDGGGAGRSVT